jgi:hypothetical protein
VRDGPIGDERIRWPDRPPAAAELPDAFETWRRFYDTGAPDTGVRKTEEQS